MISCNDTRTLQHNLDAPPAHRPANNCRPLSSALQANSARVKRFDEIAYNLIPSRNKHTWLRTANEIALAGCSPAHIQVLDIPAVANVLVERGCTRFSW